MKTAFIICLFEKLVFSSSFIYTKRMKQIDHPILTPNISHTILFIFDLSDVNFPLRIVASIS